MLGVYHLITLEALDAKCEPAYGHGERRFVQKLFRERSTAIGGPIRHCLIETLRLHGALAMHVVVEACPGGAVEA